MLDPTVRDPDRRAAFEVLAPTSPPPSSEVDSPGAAVPAGLQQWPAGMPRGLRFVRWLEPAGTGEVDRVAVARRLFAPQDVVVKFYRPGCQPREGVWEAWRRIHRDRAIRPMGRRVARLLRSGTVDGRAYEIMPDGGDPLGDDPAARRLTLRDVLRAHPGGLPEAVVTDLVRQLAEAVEAMGTAGLAHLDLRPENVLARRRSSETPAGRAVAEDDYVADDVEEASSDDSWDDIEDVAASPTSVAPGGDAAEQAEQGWDLTVVDFGISAVIETGGPERIDRATMAYSSPDVIVNSASRGSDYWSLGIMVAELATGGHRFFDLDEFSLRRELADNNAPAPDGMPDRLAQLYRGLTAPQAHRWGADEVRDWLAGETVPPPPDRETNPSIPFPFRGEDYRHPVLLAAALQLAWAEAADVLTGPAADRWEELLGWLKQFDRPGRISGPALRSIRFWGGTKDPASPDARLLLVLSWMAPGLPEHRYRHVRIDHGRLARIALASLPEGDEPADRGWTDDGDLQDRGATGSGLAREVVEDLWRWPLLPELKEVSGLRGADEVDAGWRDLFRHWHDLLAVVRSTRSPLGRHLRDLTGTQLLAYLLRMAASQDYVAYLRRDLDATRELIERQLSGSYPVYDEFVTTVLPFGVEQDSPDVAVGLLAVHRLRGFVVDRVNQEAERRADVARSAMARDLAWRRRERWRLLDRPAALGWAAAAMAVVGLTWAAVFIVGGTLPRSWSFVPHSAPAALTLAWGVVGVCVGAETAVELWLAALIGAPYHRGYSLASALIQFWGAAGERFTGTVGAVIVLAGLGVVGLGLLALVLAAPYALPIPIFAAHLWWARRRHARWTADHADLRAQFAASAPA